MHKCLLLAFSLFACAHGGLEGRTYRKDNVEFAVGEIPASWRKIDLTEAALAFRDEAHAASVLVNGRCGISSDDAPLASLTQHLLMGTTEREVVDERKLLLDGREALRSVAVAKQDGVPKQYVLYVLKKDGCVYDFVLVGEPESVGGAMPAFDAFVQAFRTLGRGALR